MTFRHININRQQCPCLSTLRLVLTGVKGIPPFGEYLRTMIIRIGKQTPEIEVIEVNTDSDHVHILLSIPPKISISDVVKMVKAKTGLRMRNKFPFLDKVYWAKSGIWSRGYFVSTVGISEATIRKYIEMQGKEDSGQALLEF